MPTPTDLTPDDLGAAARAIHEAAMRLAQARPIPYPHAVRHVIAQLVRADLEGVIIQTYDFQKETTL